MSDNNFKLAREFTEEKIAPEYLEIYSNLFNAKAQSRKAAKF